jgi:hypothetical protein
MLGFADLALKGALERRPIAPAMNRMPGSTGCGNV